ncbi:MAG TPA: CBS domain-containing protein [Methylomirabilota bacterium]|nr:CBS domain-containing protein [Methylomirabilota bacterium]
MKECIEVTTTNDGAASGAAELELSATCVADIMTTQLVTLFPHHTFAEAVQLMSNSSFRHFLVIQADGRLAGVFSDRDVLRALGRTPNWQAKTISGVMTRYVITVKPQTPISVAVSEMLERRINCLPVVGDDGKVCGIITSTDLLKRYQRIQASLETNSNVTEF